MHLLTGSRDVAGADDMDRKIYTLQLSVIIIYAFVCIVNTNGHEMQEKSPARKVQGKIEKFLRRFFQKAAESRLARLVAQVGQDAAVGVEDLPVDEVGGVGGQEDAGAHHVLGFAPAAGRGLGDDKGVEGAAAAVRLALAQGRGLRGGDVAGAHAVALDVVLAELGGDVLGQHLEAALGRRAPAFRSWRAAPPWSS